MLGKEQLLYIKLPSGKDLVISQPGHYNFEIDKEYTFTLDAEALHFFDGKTEERIN